MKDLNSIDANMGGASGFTIYALWGDDDHLWVGPYYDSSRSMYIHDIHAYSMTVDMPGKQTVLPVLGANQVRVGADNSPTNLYHEISFGWYNDDASHPRGVAVGTVGTAATITVALPATVQLYFPTREADANKIYVDLPEGFELGFNGIVRDTSLPQSFVTWNNASGQKLISTGSVPIRLGWTFSIEPENN